MTEISWRHHYIPQFYLRNFTNDEDKFHIYLIKENRYKANGKLFSPESHFFEENGNTLSSEEGITDFLETDSYKQIDNDTAILFNKIKYSTESRYGLSEADMPMLQFFVAHLFWRNPSRNEFTKALILRKGLSGLGLKVKDIQTDETLIGSEIEKKMMENESTYKFIKYWLPSALYQNLFNNNSPLSILSFTPGDIPSLICDNPLILRNPQKFDVYKDDFILPLGRDKILIRTNKLKAQYQNITKILIDNLLIKQANKFVSTTDLEYIDLLYNLRKDKSIEYLRDEIFSNLVDE